MQKLGERIAPRFARLEARQRALAYLKGLLAPIERKNSWQLAEQAGEQDPYAFQHLLGRAQWEAEQLRDDLREYVTEHLAEQPGVLVVDETGFLKQGQKSVGVQRQYSGTAGRIENCQIGVFLIYASSKGTAFIDRELYLPKAWVDDAEQRRQTSVPEEIKFQTKIQLARTMLARAIEAEVPFEWVTADAVYGGDYQFRKFLKSQGKSYVLAVTAQQRLWLEGEQQRVDDIATCLPPAVWRRLSAGSGSKGERLYDWAYMTYSHIDGSEWQKGLLIRRSISNPDEYAYYLVHARAQTQAEEIVRIAGLRWNIEQCFKTAKEEIGLDQYEVRSWHGWYRHITLSLLAHAFLAVLRSQAIEEKKGEPLRSNSLSEFKNKRGLCYL
ncbi:IS701 family transposase [Gloeobacter morelensis MG652769]|uniref:IS701 family transposase n=1 Tax=Gloeobacter morelensis MG652769 TaxID=2781736 RepID=A0ABY3PU42_9CYAN|nr:IS701 family transposase [Gloeobacter morelensis MG652769]